MNMRGGMVHMTGYPVMVVVVVVITTEKVDATRIAKDLINTMVGCLCIMICYWLYQIFKKVFILIYQRVIEFMFIHTIYQRPEIVSGFYFNTN